MEPGITPEVIAFMSPLLPYLVKAGEQAVATVGKEVGSAAWKAGKAIWEKLWPKVEAKPAGKEAAEEVAAHPEDEDALAALRMQLKKLLSEDEQLAREVAGLWKQAKSAGVTIIASGERSVAAQNITGIVSTGDIHMQSPRTEKKEAERGDDTQ